MIRREGARVEGSGKLEIRKVIGLTVSNANGLASCPATDNIAYAAGCVVVVYSTSSHTQTGFLTSPKANKAIASLAYSASGKLLAAGEAGHQPAVLVWDTSTRACLAELKVHRYGIACLSFSPNGKHLVSVGAPHDGQVCVWDWKNGLLLAKVRAAASTAPICALTHSPDGASFATGGVKHVNSWSIAGSTANQRAKPSTGGALESRPVAVGAQKESNFVSLATGPSPTLHGVKPAEETGTMYGLTAAGVLCLLRGGKALEKWVDLKVQAAFALRVSRDFCACACAGGVVRLFAVNTLAYVATLPKPLSVKHYQGLGKGQPATADAFPDAVGCAFIGELNQLAVVYLDHSLYIWDVNNLANVTLQRCFQGHAASIWDVASVPRSSLLDSEKPAPALVTCSADGSVRLWNLDEGREDQRQPEGRLMTGCQELLGAFHLEGPAPSAPSSSLDDLRTSGFRSLTVHPDGCHVAAGDRGGNLRVYDLASEKLISFQEAHDSEVLTLSYTESREGGSLLASGGRDRLIHLYDVERNYDVIETLDDHSASITAVRFASNGSKLLSCSADKSVVFRNLAGPSTGLKASRYHQEVAPRGSLYDLDVDPGDKLVVTAGQDKRLTLYSLATGKPVKSFRPDSDAGEPIKVKMDPGGVSLLCSHADKCIRIFDSQSGELLGKGTGHSEVVTGLVLAPTCDQLISVSGDSCLFVWQLPDNLSRSIRKKAAAFARPSAPPLPPPLMDALHVPQVSEAKREAGIAPLAPPKDDVFMSEESLGAAADEGIDFKMSLSKLPSWAQPKGASGATRAASKPAVLAGDSRWAQRLAPQGYKLFSESDDADVRASGFGQARKFTPEKVCEPTVSESEVRRHSSGDVGETVSPSQRARRASEGAERRPREEAQAVYNSDSDFEDEASGSPKRPEASDADDIERTDVASPGLRDAAEKGAEGPCGVNASEGVNWDDDDDAVELGEAMEDSPRQDLFAAHFDSLQKQTPLDTTRQSLSARFFARHSLSLSPGHTMLASPPVHPPVETPEHEAVDLSDNSESLAQERERLKQKDRQTRLAVEVARMRERMSGLGISILPRGPSEASDKNATEVLRERPGENDAQKSGWMVADRSGRSVPPPSLAENGTAAVEGVAHGIESPSQLENENLPESMVAKTESREEKNLAEGRDRSPRSAVNEERSKGESTAEGATPMLAHRISPWASHTNPLFDTESPPVPVKSLAATKLTGTISAMVAGEEAAMAEDSETSEADSEVTRILTGQKQGHVANHVPAQKRSPTPSPQRSQSPDLDHERAQRTEPPLEPLVLDHTKRNGVLSPRFESPSLSEGVPTIGSAQPPAQRCSPSPPSDISFPRLLEPGDHPSSRLGFHKADVSDSEDDDAEVLQPVAFGGVPGQGRTEDASKAEKANKEGENLIRVASVEEGRDEIMEDIQTAAQEVEPRRVRKTGVHWTDSDSSRLTNNGTPRKAVLEDAPTPDPHLGDQTGNDFAVLNSPLQAEASTTTSESAHTQQHSDSHQEQKQATIASSAGRMVEECSQGPAVGRPKPSPTTSEQTSEHLQPSGSKVQDQVAGHVPPLAVSESVELPRPVQEYQSALRALVDAADRASLLFEELKAYKAHSLHMSRPGEKGAPDQSLNVSALKQSYQEFVPSAVQKLQAMMQDRAVSSDQTFAPCEDAEGTADEGLRNKERSLPVQSGEVEEMDRKQSGKSRVDSMLASVDMQAVLERYSSRYSEMLAKQLLALMSKSLQFDKVT